MSCEQRNTSRSTRFTLLVFTQKLRSQALTEGRRTGTGCLQTLYVADGLSCGRFVSDGSLMKNGRIQSVRRGAGSAALRRNIPAVAAFP